MNVSKNTSITFPVQKLNYSLLVNELPTSHKTLLSIALLKETRHWFLASHFVILFFNIYLRLWPIFYKLSFWIFQPNPYTNSAPPVRATYTAHLILHIFIILIISDDNKSRSFLIFIFLTSFVLVSGVTLLSLLSLT